MGAVSARRAAGAERVPGSPGCSPARGGSQWPCPSVPEAAGGPTAFAGRAPVPFSGTVPPTANLRHPGARETAASLGTRPALLPAPRDATPRVWVCQEQTGRVCRPSCEEAGTVPAGFSGTGRLKGRPSRESLDHLADSGDAAAGLWGLDAGGSCPRTGHTACCVAPSLPGVLRPWREGLDTRASLAPRRGSRGPMWPQPLRGAWPRPGRGVDCDRPQARHCVPERSKRALRSVSERTPGSCS